VCEVDAYLAIRFCEGKKIMPTLLNSRRTYGWQLIMNNDLVEDTVEHYQLMLEGGHTFVMLLLMPGCIGIVIGFVMHFRGTSKDVTIVSGLILHAGLVSGYVVLVMFVMFWMSRSVVTESV
jgi:hypothetical protein